MRRRDFLMSSAATGIVGFATCDSIDTARAQESTERADDIVKRVKQAMLTMQRASWEQGVAAQAYLELGDHNTVYLLAKEMALRQTPDGRLGVVYTDGGTTDGAMGGEALVSAARRSGDPELQKALDRELNWVLHKCPRTADGTLYHRMAEPEVWVDSMNTTPPFLTAAGKFDEALKQIRGHRRLLWDADAKLYRHQWSDAKHDFVNPNHWGVGNGWVASALARVIHLLPKEEQAKRDECIGYAREVLDGCLAHLRPDGLFHNDVDQIDTFVETNLSQMLAYTIYCGVQDGWLGRRYLDHAEKMRAAAHAKVDKFGYVQDVCGAPQFNAPGRATEGQAFFLRMEAARRDGQFAGRL
jgi:rhamnogalacturonyl hydrolase YesR